MPLQTSVAIRVTIPGDGESKEISFDLLKTLVQIMDATGGSYGILPIAPNSIIWLSVGGPGISPEMNNFARAELNGSVLRIEFAAPLLRHPDSYIVSLILGYDGIPAPEV